MMHYRYLSEIGDHYAGEANNPNLGLRENQLVWKSIVDKLKLAIVDLRDQIKQSNSAPVAVTGSSVRDLVRFHQAQQRVGDRDKAVEEARKKVDNLRHWLAAQGVTTDKDGDITNIERREVVYDNSSLLQSLTQVHFAGGRLFTDSTCRKPLDTGNMLTHFSGPGKAIFVMSQSGNIHFSSHIVGNRHHSSLLAGANVACGGEFQVVNGHLSWLSNKSGHYRPQVAHLLQVLHQLQKKGVPMGFSLRVMPDNATYADVGQFLTKLRGDDQPDYELSKLLAYSKWLKDDMLLASVGWRWRFPSEEAGVYEIATNRMVPHKQVRAWFKLTNRKATNEVQSGFNR